MNDEIKAIFNYRGDRMHEPNIINKPSIIDGYAYEQVLTPSSIAYVERTGRGCFAIRGHHSIAMSESAEKWIKDRYKRPLKSSD